VDSVSVAATCLWPPSRLGTVETGAESAPLFFNRESPGIADKKIGRKGLERTHTHGRSRTDADRTRVPSGVDSSQRCGGGAAATGLS
jgi:hypothetical protein